MRIVLRNTTIRKDAAYVLTSNYHRTQAGTRDCAQATADHTRSLAGVLKGDHNVLPET